MTIGCSTWTRRGRVEAPPFRAEVEVDRARAEAAFLRGYYVTHRAVCNSFFAHSMVGRDSTGGFDIAVFHPIASHRSIGRTGIGTLHSSMRPTAYLNQSSRRVRRASTNARNASV